MFLHIQNQFLQHWRKNVFTSFIQHDKSKFSYFIITRKHALKTGDIFKTETLSKRSLGWSLRFHSFAGIEDKLGDFATSTEEAKFLFFVVSLWFERWFFSIEFRT